MLTARTVQDLRDGLGPVRRAGSRIGLVPTMGALHAGHLSLLHRARVDCDTVVMSLFVNPRQFNDAGDLRVYPRDEARDAQLAAAEGVDILFAPAVDAVYPPGFATVVSVAGPGEPLEGVHRGRSHFQAVATVVCKLLNMVGPDVVYFGQKDAQQAAVIRRMVRDLDIPSAVEVRPTVREPDGLALSSRNALLSGAERERAAALHRALQSVAAAVDAGETDPAAATAAGRAGLRDTGAALDYLELVDPETMAPLTRIDRDALAVVAAVIGSVRLIDNLFAPIPITQPEVATPLWASTA